MKSRSKNCCKEAERITRENGTEEILEKEVEAGTDHAGLAGFYRHGRSEIKKKAAEFLSGNGSMYRVRVRYKPREVVAYFVQSDHQEENKPDRDRKTGWLIPSPGDGQLVYYVSEDQFTRAFEIVNDEERRIA